MNLLEKANVSEKLSGVKKVLESVNGDLTGKYKPKKEIFNLLKDLTDEEVKAAIAGGQFDKQTANVLLRLKGFSKEAVDSALSTGKFVDSAEKGSSVLQNLAKEAGQFGKDILGVLKEIGIFLATNPIGWLIDIAAGIAIATVAYKKFNTSAKEANENITNAFTESQSQVKSVNQQKETVDKLAESYEKLSKGVNTATNENISLNTDSYKEYLDTCNQIADIYPDLVEGYDAQGNAILSLKGNVDALTDSYKKAQEEAYATAYYGVEGDNGKRTGGAKDRQKAIDYVTNKFDSDDKLTKFVGNNIAQSYTYGHLESTTNELIATYGKMSKMSDEELQAFITDSSATASVAAKQWVEKIKDGSKESYDAVRRETQQLLNELQNNQNEVLKEEQTALEGYMKGVVDAGGKTLASGYDKLTEKQQTLATTLLSSLSFEDVQAFQNSDDFEKAEQQWVNNLVSSISTMSAETKNAYDELQQSIANPGDLTTESINKIDGYLGTLEKELGVSKDKLKEIMNLDDVFDTENSFGTKINELFSSFDDSDVQKADDALAYYKDVMQEVQDLGVDLNQTVFGNIDLNNRQVLKWTDDTLNQYKEVLQSWDEEAVNNWEQFAADWKGTVSTVFGGAENFDEVEIAFSPMLQTDHGAVMLSSDTVYEYIDTLMSQLPDSWYDEDLFKLDSEGLDIDGQHIKNLIADIGETADKTAESMHYVGKDGAVALAERDVEKYSDALNENIDVVSSAQKANDDNSKSLDKSTKSVKTNAQAIKWLKENASQMTVSQKKMFLEAANGAENALEAVKNYEKLLQDNAMNTMSIDIVSVTEHINNLNTALSESASATGLTADSISNLKAMFSGLDGYDASALFMNTANGVKVNREELEKLNQEYAKQNASKAQEQLGLLQDKYNDLTDQINTCSDASQAANLYAQRDAVLDQINDVQSLISQYDGLTSAFNEWQNAQNETSPGANYDSMYSYIETANELASDGKWGNQGLRKYMELISGQDLSDKTSKGMAEVWDHLGDTIDGTSHNLMEFLTKDKSGVEAFIDTLKQLDKGYIQVGEDGQYIFKADSLKGLASDLGTDVSYVQVLLDKLSEYGWKIEVDSTDLELAATNAEEANNKLKDLFKDDEKFQYSFNFSADLDTIDAEIDKAKELMNDQRFKDANGNFDISIDGAAEAQQVLVALLAQKESLREPTIMQIDTEKLEGTNKTVINTLQNIQSTIDGYDIQLGANMDTSEMSKKIGDALDEIDKINPEIQKQLGLADPKVKSAIANLKQNISKGIELSPNSLLTIQEALSSISPEILASLGIDMDNVQKDADEVAQSFETALTNVLSNLTITVDGKEIKFDIKQPDPVKITADTTDVDKSVNKLEKEKGVYKSGWEAVMKTDNSDVMSKVSSGTSALDNFNGKTVTAYMKVQSSVQRTVSAGIGMLIGVAQKINGTLHGFANGTLRGYTSGTNVSIQKNETALVNEVGTEGLLRNGVLTELPGGAHLEKLQKGDIIFNHLQMEQLRNNGYVTANGGHGQLIGGYAYGTLTGTHGYPNLKDNYYGSGSGSITTGTNQYGDTSSSSSSSKSGSSSKSKSSSGSSSKSSGSSNTSSSSSSTNTEADKTEETLDWIETKISRVKRVIENLGKTVSATYRSWTDRNNSLTQELSEVNSEISIQQQAYDRYMQQANSVGLDAGYVQLVRDGKIDIETITDDDLKQKIEDYKNWFEKAIECSDAILDLKDNLYDLAKTNFDSITKQFEDQLNVITHSVNMVEGYIDLAETRGYLASTDYYDNLINLETQNIGTLKNEYDSLTGTLNNLTNSGQIEKYSEAWYELYSQICDVEESLQDATKALSEYESKMRELKWSYFEKEQDYITNFTEETQWLIDLLEKQGKFVDDNNGKLTNRGIASMGLHAVGYNTYMAQADDYANEIQKINQQLATDPYNTILIDKRQEYLKAQRDSIDAAYDEIDATKSLIKEGYDAQLDALDKLIEKRKKYLDNEKSIYDYQRSVAEKVDAIASYEKQLKAYENDNSEEGMAKRQQAEKNLKDAKTDLQETEWEQQISDVEQMMSDMRDDYEDFLNTRLDDLNFILNTMLDSANQNSGDIQTTLTEATTSVGTTLSDTMNNVWSSNSGLNSIVAAYGNGFNNVLTTTNNTLASIEVMIKSMVQEAQRKATEDAAKQAAAAQAVQQQPVQQQQPQPVQQQSQPQQPAKASGDFFIYKKDSFPKNRLNKENSIVDFS